MKIAIVGTGYVGLVTGTCLAEVGHRVMCVDKDAGKVSRLKNAEVDIYEPGLTQLVKNNIDSGHLTFTESIAEGVHDATAVFIAVGTPPNEDGSTDLSYVLAVAESIGQSLQHSTVVIVKSTVPVGTCHKVQATINACLKKRRLAFEINVVSNPEFLKEGAAIGDFTRPDRIVVGSNDEHCIAIMRDIYAPYNRKMDRIIVMDVLSSELTKYAANAMLATKISFINEIANIAESIGADIEQVRKGIGSDPRIGYQFIYPGCGYGGYCFPKDVKSLVKVAAEVGHRSRLLEAVDAVNEQQKHILLKHLLMYFKQGLKGKTIAVWGLSFKPETNDIREAPSCVLLEGLWSEGANVRAYDPVAMPEIEKHYGPRAVLALEHTKEDALRGADALVICTEWKAFKVPEYELMRDLLKEPVVIDGRNLYEPERMKQEGFHYYAIGRGESCKHL